MSSPELGPEWVLSSFTSNDPDKGAFRRGQRGRGVPAKPSSYTCGVVWR